MSALKYRADIDGLRALAVLPVILFHAGASWLPGGFVGVDIFFVISGYLISSIILREVQAGEFSFLRFYERRIRRIIPALLVMLLVTVALFQIIALPDQAQEAAESAIAALLSVSNFYFWRQSGYFAPTAEFLPLLHTWSLAVEEQFYLIFPVLILGLWKLRLPIKWLLVIGTLIAFAASLWLSINKPSVAYYLLPARAWELAIGAVIAAGAVPRLRGSLLNEAVPALGVAMILFSVFYIRSDMIFPGWVALIPCLGAAMVIHANGNSWTARRILATRPMVFIGFLSYSLYLWHWPIFVSSRVYLVSHRIEPAVALAGIATTFILAWISWSFIERPFRNRQTMPQRRMLRVLGGGLVAVASIAGISIVMNGFLSRLSEQGHALLAGTTDTAHYQLCPERTLDRACRFGSPTGPVRMMVVGDSQTPALYSVFDALASSNNVQGILLWHSACPLMDGAWRDGDGYRASCFAFLENVFQKIETLPELELVVLVGSWHGQLEASPHPLLDDESHEPTPEDARRVFSRSIDRTLNKLEEKDLATIILGSFPGAGFDVPRLLALSELNGANIPHYFDASDAIQVQIEIDSLLQTAAQAHYRSAYVTLWDIFCFQTSCFLTVAGKSIYADGGHLTASSVKYLLSPTLLERLRTVLKKLEVQ